MNDALANLQITFDELVLRSITDDSGLESLVEKAKEIEDGEWFTNDSWALFQETLESAEILLEDEVKTQQEVDDKCIALQAALDQLALNIKEVYYHDSPAIDYSGDTMVVDPQNDYFNGNSAVYNGSGNAASISLTFTGTTVSVIGTKQSNTGSFNVYIDDKFVEQINTNSPTRTPNQILFTTDTLSNTEHTIRLEVDSNTFIVFEGFVVGQSDGAIVANVGEYDSNSPYMLYNSNNNWFSDTNSGYFKGNAVYSNTSGDSISLAFTGTSIGVVFTNQFNSGHFEVYIDGVFKALVNTNILNGFDHGQELFFDDLTDETHIIKIVVLGNGDNDYVVFEGFVVEDNSDAVGAGIYNADHASVVYQGNNWESLADDGLLYGTTKYSNTQNNSVSLTFTGTSISLIGGIQYNSGEFAVFINGEYIDTIDSNSGDTTGVNWGQVLFSRDNLPNKKHTIEIVVLGNGDNDYVVFEGFVVG